MTSEDVEKLVKQMERQNKALESIARSLEKLSSPPVNLTTFTQPPSNTGASFTNPPKF